MQAPSAATAAKSLIVTPSSSASSTSLSPSASAAASAKAAKTASIRSSTDSNCEIEEISKKISEHADAIYRTWKCRGLAPTELLDFYTAAAAADTTATSASDFFGASSKAVVTDVVTSTEGLQQLVNTFVIKDKQQRSNIMSNTATKSASNRKSPILTATTTTTTTDADLVAEQIMLTKQQKTANIMKQAKPATQRPSAILLPETTTVAASTAAATTKNHIAYSAKKSPTTTTNQHNKTTRETAAIASATTQRNACASDKNYQPATKELQQQQQQQQHQAAALTATQKTKIGNNKFAKDMPDAVPLNLGLDLDLNNLTQLQTENLLKIKELLQQESEIVAKPKKTTSAAKTTASTKNKRALTELASGNATATSRRAGDTFNHDKPANIVVSSNDNIVVVVAPDKNSNCTKKSPIIAANKTLINEQQQHASNSNSSSNANQIQNQNKTKSEDKNIKNKVLKTSNSSSISGNATNNSSINKSTNNNNKMPKEKSVASAKNSLSSKASTSATVPTATKAIPSTTIAATLAPTSAATATSNASSATSSTPTSTTPATSQSAAENVMEVARSSMPAPTKVKTARPLTNGQDKNLGRPILTRGSVAERVLMFEKCPDVRHSFLNIKRPDPVDAPPKSLLKVKLHATPPQPSEQNSLQREIRISGKNVYIPRFYFPHGKPQPQIAIERTLRGILSAFDSFPNNQVTKDELPRILKLCGLPFYWRMPVMVFCQQGQSGLVERQRFVEFWKQMNVYCHDNASRFVYILSRGQRFRSYIQQEDLAPLVQDVVDTHPGLAFLKEATEFHSRYVHTVIARIFYSVNRCWSGKISISELKKSDLLEIITLLEEEDDINQIMAFFSYEHFYVIYCKFWELDRDHDLLINQDDLARHSDHALSTRIIERIFSGCVTRSDNKKEPDDEPKMSYTDFVWFLLSEEDKRTPTAIEYWFRCMDVDGDGVLSMYELEYFYEEQQQRMESIGIETLPFEDCLCQMLDMIKPQNRDCITLGDLKRCKMTHVFFDTFFNLEKYLDHEQRDPFASQRDEYSSDWDRFAAQEYELLITEEND